MIAIIHGKRTLICGLSASQFLWPFLKRGGKEERKWNRHERRSTKEYSLNLQHYASSAKFITLSEGTSLWLWEI